MNRETNDGLKPAYTITEDDRMGIIRIVVAGFFDRQTLVEHFAATKQILDKWRALGRSICVLIDATRLKPHSPENQVYAREETARIYRPSDRVALLLESSLVKMQMRRAETHDDVGNFFLSESAAIAWLTAHSR